MRLVRFGDRGKERPGLLTENGIAYVSEDMTLLPGDVISTGTPAGVGIFRDPPLTLKAGNVVTCEIEKIGVIRNECRGS